MLLTEIDDLHNHDVDTGRLFISDRAHLTMPYHTILDGLEEERRNKGALGTTRREIGPVFADKVARLGIRTGDLLDKEIFWGRLSAALELKNAVLKKVYRVSLLSLEEIYDQYCHYGEHLAPFIRETGPIIHEAAKKGEFVLLEGA